MDVTKSDIALYKDNKIFETGTSNLLFIRNNKIYSPINNFYKGTTFKFFSKKLKKIKKKNILIDSLNTYDEIVYIKLLWYAACNETQLIKATWCSLHAVSWCQLYYLYT